MRVFKYIAIIIAAAATSVSAMAQEFTTQSAQSNNNRYVAVLSGAQEVTDPAGGVQTPMSGRVVARFDSAYSSMRVLVRLEDIDQENIVAAHFHCGRAGQNGPLALGLIAPGPLSLQGNRIRGTLTNANVMGTGCDEIIGRPINNLVSLARAMEDGLIYLNVHSESFPAGIVRGQMGRRY